MSIGEDELEVGFPNEGDEEEMDISFDDAPPQDKAEVAARAVKAAKQLTAAARAVKAAKAATSPKPKVTRKTTVARTAKKAVAAKSHHRVETIDNNKLAAYLDRIVNDEGYQLISVSGSTSIMGSFTIVSVLQTRG